MKNLKKILSTIALLAMIHDSYSQCNPAIPANATVIDSTQSTYIGSLTVWICSGDSLTSYGGSYTIYLESGAYVLTNGGSNTVYVPQGAKSNTPSGMNTIFFVDSADLINTGGAIPTQCSAITYDYSNAPTNGCPFTTGAEAVHAEPVINIFPNPANELFTVYGLQFAVGAQLNVYDVFGRQFFSQHITSANCSVKTAGWNPGVYFIRLTDTENSIAAKRIFIQ